jgi:hypothetical protein
LVVLGHPERSSFSTDTRTALKHECHSKTAVQLKECSPKASDLLSFMQNLIQTHCLILAPITDKMKHEAEKALV